MNEVYINARDFRNDDFYQMFHADLIPIQDLVDKIYELNDILEETLDKVESLNEELEDLQRENSLLKQGFRPD